MPGQSHWRSLVVRRTPGISCEARAIREEGGHSTSRRPPGPEGRGGCGLGFALWIAAVAGWAFLLYGFVSTASLSVLCLLGATLALGGLYLAGSAALHAAESPWYLGAFTLGVAMLAGAAATLAPAAPGPLLARWAGGWEMLEQRAQRLGAAIDDEDVALAARLARRGLGETAPLGRDGRPLIHGAKDVQMLDALLEGGLDPDARDSEDRTLLLNTWDLAMARALLAAGADPDARSRGGRSVLEMSVDKDPQLVDLLLEAGARESGGDATAPARTDWVVERDLGAAEPARVDLDHRPLRRGDLATLAVQLVNDSDEPRRLDVVALLNDAALFVAASHDGAIQNPAQLRSQQTIRWPRLALPAHSRGQLQLEFVTRSDEQVGDLSIDVRVRTLPGFDEQVLQVYEKLGGSGPRADVAAGVWPAALLVAIVVGLGAMLRRTGDGTGPARSRAAARTLSGLAAAVCAGVTVLLVWSAAVPYLGYEEASCTVLDRRAQMRRSSTSGTGSSRGAGRTTASSYLVPLAAVRIDTGAETVIATGFAAGIATRFVQELREFPLGGTVPCWVEPGAPRTFTLVRRPSAAGVAGIGMMLLLTAVLTTIARRI